MDTNWRGVVDRYFSPEEQARWNEQLAAVPDLDAAAYNARWFDLGSRIAEDLPLDLASPAAQAYLDEWQALLAPFTAVATPEMMAGATSLYDRMGEWQTEQPSPFPMDVWSFIKAAGSDRREKPHPGRDLVIVAPFDGQSTRRRGGEIDIDRSRPFERRIARQRHHRRFARLGAD
jgi:hypothetical protein